jgi:Lar family restriction alleviation protein
MSKEQNELKPCPFCGGEAELKINRVYTSNGICVHCKECNAHTKTTIYDCTYVFYHGQQNVFITKERAEQKAVLLWNRRADNEQRAD